jgi:hypothetical protein
MSRTLMSSHTNIYYNLGLRPFSSTGPNLDRTMSHTNSPVPGLAVPRLVGSGRDGIKGPLIETRSLSGICHHGKANYFGYTEDTDDEGNNYVCGTDDEGNNVCGDGDDDKEFNLKYGENLASPLAFTRTNNIFATTLAPPPMNLKVLAQIVSTTDINKNTTSFCNNTSSDSEGGDSWTSTSFSDVAIIEQCVSACRDEGFCCTPASELYFKWGLKWGPPHYYLPGDVMSPEDFPCVKSCVAINSVASSRPGVPTLAPSAALQEMCIDNTVAEVTSIAGYVVKNLGGLAGCRINSWQLIAAQHVTVTGPNKGADALAKGELFPAKGADAPVKNDFSFNPTNPLGQLFMRMGDGAASPETGIVWENYRSNNYIIIFYLYYN